MALFVADTRGDQASTHALIIGVGGYQYLKDGKNEKPKLTEIVGEIPQLTSPSPSAIAFAEFLRAAGAKLRAKLGSIDLLISPAPGHPLPKGVEAAPATIDNIEAAYAAWRDRCDRNPDNIAIFYFSGHGMEKTEQFLLAEDFGAKLNPWDGSFEFESTRQAFHTCRAETQCFFIDACRNVPIAVLENRPRGRVLDNTPEIFTESLYGVTLLGSARAQSALGPKRKPSYFVQALIRALEGDAATEGQHGNWVVTTAPLGDKINKILPMIKNDTPQRCIPHPVNDTELITIDGIPSVWLTLDCDPEDAKEIVELTCKLVTDPPQDAIHIRRHRGAPLATACCCGYL